MAQIIDFTAGLRDRSIESIPQVQPPREYLMTVNGRLILVRYVERFDEWVWGTKDCRWWDREYLTGGKGFENAAEAAQDALRWIEGVQKWTTSKQAQANGRADRGERPVIVSNLEKRLDKCDVLDEQPSRDRDAAG